MVHRPHHPFHRFFVRRLARGKAAFVHAVVQGLVKPVSVLVQGLPQLVGKEVQVRVHRPLVELIVQHANDISALIVHNRPRPFVPKDRNGELALGIPGFLVELPDGSGAVDVVGDAPVAREAAPACGTRDRGVALRAENPARVVVKLVVKAGAGPRGMRDADGNDVIEAWGGGREGGEKVREESSESDGSATDS